MIVVNDQDDSKKLEIWRVLLDGGAPQKSPLAPGSSDGAELTPQVNGNRLVWITGEMTPEIWAVDNVLPGK